MKNKIKMKTAIYHTDDLGIVTEICEIETMIFVFIFQFLGKLTMISYIDDLRCE